MVNAVKEGLGEKGEGLGPKGAGFGMKRVGFGKKGRGQRFKEAELAQEKAGFGE